MHEGDEPDAVADLSHAYGLSGEHVTEIDLPVLEANPAAVGHREREVVERIPRAAVEELAAGALTARERLPREP